MPIPVHAATGTYTETSASTASFAVPSGVANGDIIVIPIFVDNASTTITGYAAGFAEAGDSPQATGINSLHVVWKRATGADTGTYDFTLSQSRFHTGSALRYTGAAAAGDPWDDTDGAVDDTTGTTTPAVSVTTTGADRLLIWAATSWHVNSWTPPTGFTERVDAGFGTVTAADKDQAVAGSSGSVTGTPANTSRRCAWLGALIGASSTVTGVVSVSLGSLQATVTGTRGVAGAVTVSLGALTVTAQGMASAPSSEPVTGSWYGLLDIYREAAQIAREEHARPPVACPLCGEPLTAAPRGGDFCRFDGWGAGS